MASRLTLRLVAPCLVAGLVGCATPQTPAPETPTAEAADDPGGTAPAGTPPPPPVATPAPPPPAPAPPQAAPAPAPPASAPAAARSGDRTVDGIDDENWLPRKDTAAYSEFVDATQMVRRDPRQAADRFAAAARASPGFYAAWFNAGAAAEAAGDVRGAESHYRASLRVRPDYGPALTNLAALLSKMGRDADAQQLVDAALRASPDKAGPHVAAAVRALKTRDLQGAEREARAAIAADERSVPAMLVMAQLFRAQGRLDTAMFAIDNALALEPGNALLHVERGHVLLARSERPEALIAFERASRLQPSMPEALEPYARLLLERGFGSEALSTSQSLVRLRPGSGAAMLLLGNAQRAVKDYGGAERSYKRALELDAYLDEVHFNLGVLYIDNAVGDADELVRLQKGLDALKLYQTRARPDAATQARLAEYIDNTDKRVAREQKKRERDRKRALDDAAKAKAPPPAPPPAAPAPAPKPTGAADDK